MRRLDSVGQVASLISSLHVSESHVEAKGLGAGIAKHRRRGIREGALVSGSRWRSDERSSTAIGRCTISTMRGRRLGEGQGLSLMYEPGVVSSWSAPCDPGCAVHTHDADALTVESHVCGMCLKTDRKSVV